MTSKYRVYDVRITNVGNIPNLTGNILNEGNTVGLFTTIEIVKNQLQGSSTSTASSSPSNNGGTGHHRGQQQQEHNAVGGGNQTQGSLADFLNPPPPPQYLGDLSVDSPLPFSIPLTSNNNTITAPPGNYPVALKISYSDDLKIPHQFVDTNETVSFQPLSQSGGQRPRRRRCRWVWIYFDRWAKRRIR